MWDVSRAYVMQKILEESKLTLGYRIFRIPWKYLFDMIILFYYYIDIIIV